MNICHTCNIVNEILKAFNIPFIRNLNKKGYDMAN